MRKRPKPLTTSRESRQRRSRGSRHQTRSSPACGGTSAASKPSRRRTGRPFQLSPRPWTRHRCVLETFSRAPTHPRDRLGAVPARRSLASSAPPSRAAFFCAPRWPALGFFATSGMGPRTRAGANARRPGATRRDRHPRGYRAARLAVAALTPRRVPRPRRLARTLSRAGVSPVPRVDRSIDRHPSPPPPRLRLGPSPTRSSADVPRPSFPPSPSLPSLLSSRAAQKWPRR